MWWTMRAAKEMRGRDVEFLLGPHRCVFIQGICLAGGAWPGQPDQGAGQ